MSFDTPMASTSIAQVKKYIESPKTIFEIGAYDGVDIPVLLTLFSNPEVHTFEPDPEAYNKLQQNILNLPNTNIKNNNIALSNKFGTVNFIKCLDNNLENQNERDMWYKTAQSLYHNTDFHKNGRPLLEQTIAVPCDTIDNYCNTYNVEPDVLLIDTQGSEYDILEGAKNSLKSVKVILTEWSSQELYVNQKFLTDIQQLLKQYNFELVEKINLWGDFHGDAIFVKNEK